MAGQNDREFGQRLASSRQALLESDLPNNVGATLQNIMPGILAEGELCYVQSQSSLYVYRASDTTPPSPPTVIATARGAGVPGRWHKLSSGGGGGSPGAPDRAVQFNSGGSFAGSANLLYVEGVGSQDLQFNGNGGNKITASTSLLIQVVGDGTNLSLQSSVIDATGDYLTATLGSDLTMTMGGSCTISATAPALVESSDTLILRGANELHLISNGVDWKWPTADGVAGSALLTNGAGVLSFGPASGSAPTIQNITVAGPTPITNTMLTVARVNFAGPASVTLPPGAVGKQVVVKDASGNAATNNITVTGGTIDGTGAYVIGTNRGSATFVCVSTGPDVWDVI